MTNESKVAHQIFSEEYTKIVKEKYPQKSHSWPILSGYDVLGGQFGNYIISILFLIFSKVYISIKKTREKN